MGTRWPGVDWVYTSGTLLSIKCDPDQSSGQSRGSAVPGADDQKGNPHRRQLVIQISLFLPHFLKLCPRLIRTSDSATS